MSSNRDAYLKEVRRAAKARRTAEARFRDSVIAAHGNGQQTLREIASAAGLSHVRVLQIVKSATDDEVLRHYSGDPHG